MLIHFRGILCFKKMTTTPSSTPSTSESATMKPEESSNHNLRVSTSQNTRQSTAAASAFQRPTPVLTWLDVLEKDFDKAFVDLDLIIGEVDSDQSELTFEARQKMTAISGCFAQLVHKTQSLFQKNVKLEVGFLALLLNVK